LQEKSIYRDIMDSLSAQIAILDEKGIILETNMAWQEFGAVNGRDFPMNFAGQNYLDVCEKADEESGELAAIGIRKVLSGTRKAGNLPLSAYERSYPVNSGNLTCSTRVIPQQMNAGLS
jgi:transcriptional regulator with PAS, ATPase and Fis domain